MNKSTTTDVAGAFKLTGLPPGDYTISPTLSGATFVPNRQEVTLLNMDASSVVFERQQPDEGLSSEDLERIDSAPDSWTPAEDVVLPNGQSLSDYAESRGITGEPEPDPEDLEEKN
jgi:hypothetical protein